jgi:hypothetical protein
VHFQALVDGKDLGVHSKSPGWPQCTPSKGAVELRLGRLELDAGRSSSGIRDGYLAAKSRECLFGRAQFLREVLHERPAD